jgi:ferredoxin
MIDKSMLKIPKATPQDLTRLPVKLKESDPREPGIYEVIPVRRDKCNSCNKCIEVCPENAITITL